MTEIVTHEGKTKSLVNKILRRYGGQTEASKDPKFYAVKDEIRKVLGRRSLVLVELLPKPAKVVVAFKSGHTYKF